jgi:hypothetical protein
MKRPKNVSEASSDALAKTMSMDNRRGSMAETIAAGHYRTRSNPNATGLGGYGSYPPPSASMSPAQASIGLQSPLTQHAYSPRSSPPPSASVYGSSYDLPHHARGSTQSAAELGSRDYPVGQSPRHWQRSPVEEPLHQTSLGSDFLARRQERPPGSLPPLIHQDTSTSSHGDSLLLPIPYQTHVLPPPPDPSKADRILPQPIPSTLVSSTLDVRPPTAHAHIKTSLPHVQGSPLDALLRASELARDADMQDEAAQRGFGPR